MVIMTTMLMSAAALALQVTAAGPALDSAEALEQLRMCVALPDNRAVDACRAALKLGLTPSRAAKANVFLAEALWSRIEWRDGSETVREVRVLSARPPPGAKTGPGCRESRSRPRHALAPGMDHRVLTG
jgi:hypothetical protein